MAGPYENKPLITEGGDQVWLLTDSQDGHVFIVVPVDDPSTHAPRRYSSSSRVVRSFGGRQGRSSHQYLAPPGYSFGNTTPRRWDPVRRRWSRGTHGPHSRGSNIAPSRRRGGPSSTSPTRRTTRRRRRRSSCPPGHYWSYKQKKCVKSMFR